MKSAYSYKIIIIAAALASLTHTATAQPSGRGTVNRAVQKLQRNIDAVLDDSVLKSSFIGIKIVSLENGRTLYSRMSSKLFHPASNMKLLTTAAALALLDSNFLLKTVVYSDKTPDKGILNGNLYIKGFGDPLFKTSDLDSLVRLLQQGNITTITGDIVGDISYFDDLYWGTGWMWDDEPQCHAAFITPLTINSNCVTVVVKPGNQEGDSVLISLEPPFNFFTIINLGVTSTDTTIPPLQITRLKRENTIVVSGRLDPYNNEQRNTLSIWKPEIYFLELFKSKLQENGIKVEGKIAFDTVRTAVILAEIAHPIDSVLHQINKPSDNLAAENLLKTLAAERFGTPGTAQNGLLIIKNYLASIGVDTLEMILADGSGLSHYNLISPDAIVQLLQTMYRNKLLFDRFASSLPTAGVDGTLKNRMRGTRTFQNVKAKTGTINSVSSLSGYVSTRDNKLLAFSIMTNHFPQDIKILRDAQDRIMGLLANFRFNGK